MSIAGALEDDTGCVVPVPEWNDRISGPPASGAVTTPGATGPS